MGTEEEFGTDDKLKITRKFVVLTVSVALHLI